jgi:hypothetical protein
MITDNMKKAPRKILAVVRVGESSTARRYRLVESDHVEEQVGWWLERQETDSVGRHQWVGVDSFTVGLDAQTAQRTLVSAEVLKFAWWLRRAVRDVAAPEVVVQVDGIRLAVVPATSRGGADPQYVLESRHKDAVGDEVWSVQQSVSVDQSGPVPLDGALLYLLRGWVRILAQQALEEFEGDVVAAVRSLRVAGYNAPEVGK